ncbi:hypothetical protein VNO78_37467 [Psophocarpus tetragonolobus]|uniref:Uncharacterized protein n=1 Tax=Psophocarpus tetragonolobus TaxID=3891 RepID=A0AAN9RCF4_PSOTE
MESSPGAQGRKRKGGVSNRSLITGMGKEKYRPGPKKKGSPSGPVPLLDYPCKKGLGGDSLSSKADGTFSELAKKELTCSMADKRAYPTTAREEALRESI